MGNESDSLTPEHKMPWKSINQLVEIVHWLFKFIVLCKPNLFYLFFLFSYIFMIERSYKMEFVDWFLFDTLESNIFKTLNRQTESLLMADKTQQNSRYTLCGDRDETTNHIISECS